MFPAPTPASLTHSFILSPTGAPCNPAGGVGGGGSHLLGSAASPEHLTDSTQLPWEAAPTATFILQMGKLRLREAMGLAQGHWTRQGSGLEFTPRSASLRCTAPICVVRPRPGPKPLGRRIVCSQVPSVRPEGSAAQQGLASVGRPRAARAKVGKQRGPWRPVPPVSAAGGTQGGRFPSSLASVNLGPARCLSKPPSPTHNGHTTA